MTTEPHPNLARPAFLAACVVLAVGCTSGLPDAPPNPAARPGALLSGVLCGDAVLTKPGGAVADRMVVTSRGAASGGGLVLDQTIRSADGETATRRWVVRPDGPDTYRGTLTGDEAVAASGAVRARVAGDALRIRYPVAGVPFGRMEQVLTLRADGTIGNVGTVRVLGVPVRRLTEVIRPQPGVDLDAPAPCSAPTPSETAP